MPRVAVDRSFLEESFTRIFTTSFYANKTFTIAQVAEIVNHETLMPSNDYQSQLRIKEADVTRVLKNCTHFKVFKNDEYKENATNDEATFVTKTIRNGKQPRVHMVAYFTSREAFNSNQGWDATLLSMERHHCNYSRDESNTFSDKLATYRTTNKDRTSQNKRTFEDMNGTTTTVTTTTQRAETHDTLAARLCGSQAHLEKVIDNLTTGLKNKKGWKTLVHGADDKELAELITPDDVALITQETMLLKQALVRVQNNTENETWREICTSVVDGMGGRVGRIGSGKTLEKHFTQFRDTGWKFQHPCNMVNEDGSLREITAVGVLLHFPDLKTAFLAHARANLRRVTVDFMWQYAKNYIIPLFRKELRQVMFNEQIDDDEELADKEVDCDYDSDVEDVASHPRPTNAQVEECIDDILKKQYGLLKGTVSRTTVWRWMKAVGMKFTVRKKNYYVDNHEDPRVVQYRCKYVERYLEREIRCFCWIQKTAEEVEALQEQKKLPEGEIGFPYFDLEKDIAMVELHVDSCEAFLEEMKDTLFGGNLSIRKPANVRPLMNVGQDESIFQQNSYSTLR